MSHEHNKASEYTSQGLSQSLHDKGFRGEHKNRWVSILTVREGKPFVMHDGLYVLWQNDEDFSVLCPAYTFTELWGAMPWSINFDGEWGDLALFKGPYEAEAGYFAKDDTEEIKGFLSKESPTEAVGLLLEWLIDNKHMEVEG